MNFEYEDTLAGSLNATATQICVVGGLTNICGSSCTVETYQPTVLGVQAVFLFVVSQLLVVSCCLRNLESVTVVLDSKNDIESFNYTP